VVVFGYSLPCYRPIDAYRSHIRGKTGKSLITFNRREAIGELKLPCGQCIGCRLERSRQWAMRCVHEASLYENNCFITLTYDAEHLPADGSLNKKHFQDFMKRLRWRFSESPIRYYHCGEYGTKFSRPHYHACLFNFDFLDKKYFKEVNGLKTYISDSLAEIWGRGFCVIGSVTFESAAYVARYIMKKVNGEKAFDHYMRLNEDTGELNAILPEYTTMSRRPGIGSDWLSKYRSDVFPDDMVVVRGRAMKPPKFYDSIYEVEDPEAYARLKLARVKSALKRKEDNTPARLVVRESCKEAQVDFLHRSYEDGS
jgi:hypothetical protein